MLMLINLKNAWLVPAEGYITPPTPLKKGVDNYILHPKKQPEKAKTMTTKLQQKGAV